MTMQSTLSSLKDIFIESQTSKNPHPLIQAFCKIYQATPLDEFWPEFLRLLKHPLVYGREPAVEKTIEFISKAVCNLATKTSKPVASKKDENTATNNDSAEDDEEDMHPLLMKIFEFLLSVHSAKETNIRFRVCQLIAQLLQNLGEGAQIDDSLYDDIYKCMIERLRDKSPLVRVHAVLALTRLQTPTDDTCPITKAYVILMTRDPNDDVRRIVLTSIAPSNTSLQAILQRTCDVKDKVRRTAYTVIAEKIPLRALTIEQRIQLLQDGLNDRSEVVRTACSSKLLQAWLCSCEGNVLDLLARLDVQSSVKTCEMALKILFKNSSIHDLVQKFDIINDKVLIDEAKLTCESAFYWSNLTKYVYEAGNDYEEQLDQIRPNCIEFCVYLERFAKQALGNLESKDIDKVLDLEFIIQQLLQMLMFMDLSDQASRKQTEKLLHNLLVSEKVGPSLAKYILPCLKQLFTVPEDLVNFIAEAVSEIREPITTVETQLAAEERRNIDKKIAGIRVKLHQLREELSLCIEKQEFERAAQLKSDISNLDMERSSILEASEAKVEEVRIQKNDNFTVLKCLTIVCELLKTIKLKSLPAPLQALMESQILPGMVNEEAEIRNVAVQAIGLCCHIKKELIIQHLPLLLQASQVDTQQVRSTALKSVFDIVHVYGLDAFSDADTSCDQSGGNNTEEELSKSMSRNSRPKSAQECSEDSRRGWSESASKVIAILSTALDLESSELRNIAAEGLAKLLLSGRVVSAKLFSHLLLLWYNPLIDENEPLLQTLGIFFPLFAFSSSLNQELIEEAFLPTLKTVLDAPSTSPLATVNAINVANFLVELTNAQELVENQSTKTVVKENPCHDSIAVKLCNEILSDPESDDTKFWLRVLNNLNISCDNTSLLKNLRTMCEEMATLITEKASCKYLEKFDSTLFTLLGGLAECKSDENMQQEVGDGGDTKQTLNVESVKKTRGEKATKSQPTVKSQVKKKPKKSTKQLNTSELDDNVFTTPCSIRTPRPPVDVEGTRVNLENLLMESLVKTPATIGKTPKTPKRPLHSIQDPTFTG
ncbi:condensin complex subunit 3-like [Physella acuta]|uniref:condensin complex subunit 3-like n=1 Tax=Physella acuta TaxID=109671 RepID=UPI0027DB80BA|nr:condensin complex subunit 3-like [Physella acuta]XP_059149026.1 condensin complex subunit 3-like [Physella acuta]